MNLEGNVSVARLFETLQEFKNRLENLIRLAMRMSWLLIFVSHFYSKT